MEIAPQQEWVQNLAQELRNERAKLAARATQSNVTALASNEPWDEGDQAKIYEDREARWINQRVLDHRIQMIDQSLQQIALGAYGICKQCRKPIDPARLAAMRYALSCVTCQAKNERRSRAVNRAGAYRN
ncbi:MAG: TraR/DksA family transcriptional regulator [Chloroflexi bacterium]|nr:TraR/DksA family transcriptional regulator [Chloroflexota bacterium]